MNVMKIAGWLAVAAVAAIAVATLPDILRYIKIESM